MGRKWGEPGNTGIDEHGLDPTRINWNHCVCLTTSNHNKLVTCRGSWCPLPQSCACSWLQTWSSWKKKSSRGSRNCRLWLCSITTRGAGGSVAMGTSCHSPWCPRPNFKVQKKKLYSFLHFMYTSLIFSPPYNLTDMESWELTSHITKPPYPLVFLLSFKHFIFWLFIHFVIWSSWKSMLMATGSK